MSRLRWERSLGEFIAELERLARDHVGTRLFVEIDPGHLRIYAEEDEEVES